MNMDKHKKTSLLTIAMWLIVFLPALQAEVLFVDQRATGANNGSTWEQAFTDLQQALGIAQAGDEIRIASGVYTPTVFDGDPNATFSLVSGTTVKGGYAGLGADDPDVQDTASFETILSGDLNGDDGPEWTHREDNAFNVITCMNTDANTALEAITVSGGHAVILNRSHMPGLDPNDHAVTNMFGPKTSYGGGIHIAEGSENTISDCIFRDNAAAGGGAALYNKHSIVTVKNCLFTHNRSIEFGAGIHGIGNSSVEIENCNFYHNFALNRGHAVALRDDCRMTVTNSRFGGTPLLIVGNTIHFAGGEAIFISGCRNIQMINCIFSGNNNGVISAWFQSSLDLLNCVVVGNMGWHGTVLDSMDSEVNVTNSIIWGNTDPMELVAPDFPPIHRFGQINSIDGTLNLEHSIIESWQQDNETGQMYPDPMQKDPLFVDANGPDDLFGTADDDFRLLPGSPCIDAGSNETDPNLADTDLGGLPRIINTTVDIGAHEFEGIIYVEKPEPGSGSWRNPNLGTEAYPFKNIQSALDVALTGHTVIVAPGIYSPGNHTLMMTGNNIILQSTDPSDPVTASRTIISGAVVFEGSEDPTCVLAGFRIQHNYHGAIYGNTTQATLKHCYLIDNGPCDGSVLVECDGLIQNCLIAGNMADGDCGLYPVIYRCSAEFVNCTIANNDSGIHVNNASFENCILYHNVDPNIYVDGRGGTPGSLTLNGCCVEGLYHGGRVENPEYPTIVRPEGTILDFSSVRQNDPLFVRLGTKPGGWHGSRSSEDSLGDYHLQTPGWRWSPVAFHGSHWVFDQIDSPSPCIDAAHPDKPLGEELMTIPDDPEGVYSVNRALNFGVYGGTWQASLAPSWW